MKVFPHVSFNGIRWCLRHRRLQYVWMGFAQSWQKKLLENIHSVWKPIEAMKLRGLPERLPHSSASQERLVSSEALLPTQDFSNSSSSSPFMNHHSFFICGKTNSACLTWSLLAKWAITVSSFWWPVNISFWPENPLFRTLTCLILDQTVGWKS